MSTIAISFFARSDRKRPGKGKSCLEREGTAMKMAATTAGRNPDMTDESIEQPVTAENGADVLAERLSALYYQAGDLALELGAAVRANPYGLPTEAQITGYNRILESARAMIEGSVALREDVGEVSPDPDSAAPTVDALYRALNTTIVPTLHNALTDLRPEVA